MTEGSVPNTIIRMDKTKAYSEVHGDRQPTDPHYHVHFFQDGLPYDGAGILVPDDGKNEPWLAAVETDDGKVINIKHHPLYTKEMREKVQKKRDRLNKVKSGATAEPEVEQEAVEADADADDVNFEAWLRGEVDYETFILFPAWAKRKGRKHTKLRDLVEDLVLDEKLVPEEAVAPRFSKLLNLS